MIRCAAQIALAAALLASAACNNVEVCTSAACSAPLSFTPSRIAIEDTQNVSGAPATATLGRVGSGAIAFNIRCTDGIIPAPASGTIDAGSTQAIALQLPTQTAVSVFTATCTATSATDATATAKLSVVVATSAPLTGSPGNPNGGVGIHGGSVDHLYFAVVGDSRPGNLDDTGSYPAAVISKIYQDLEALAPKPQFVVGTGDYMFSGTDSYTAGPQASLYMQAREAWSGTFFPSMGNHECDGYTANNCGLNQTQNFQVFMKTILGPNQQALPYYAVPINSTDGSWTAKLLVVACNNWDSTQSDWLKAQLAKPTTYTLLARHEPAEANTGPCVNQAEVIMKTANYDLSLVGHTHYFKGSSNSKEIVIGNGGAPLSGGTFGYVTIERISSGWRVINYDYASQLPINTFTIP
jgi:hypothetical protein